MIKAKFLNYFQILTTVLFLILGAVILLRYLWGKPTVPALIVSLGFIVLGLSRSKDILKFFRN